MTKATVPEATASAPSTAARQRQHHRCQAQRAPSGEEKGLQEGGTRGFPALLAAVFISPRDGDGARAAGSPPPAALSAALPSQRSPCAAAAGAGQSLPGDY